MIDLQQGGQVFYRANSVPGGLEEEEGMKDDSAQKAALASEETLPDVPPPSRAASLAPIDQSALAAAGNDAEEQTPSDVDRKGALTLSNEQNQQKMQHIIHCAA